MKACVLTQVAIRRVQRHPAVPHVIKGTVVGIVPGALNDIVFHHGHLDIDEIVRVTQDTLSISIINIIYKSLT